MDASVCPRLPVTRVAILGLGLMGTSLGIALRRRGLAREVAGYDLAPGVAARAHGCGAVTEVCGTVEDAVAAADLVVLATPVLAVPMVMAACAASLAPAAIVTDVCSTKAEVVRWAEELLPAPEHFIGGHPMAGRETSGPDAADAELFVGCVWCLAPTHHCDTMALAWLRELVAALGARPLVLDSVEHDEAVAAISHLPLIAAAALTLTAVSAACADLARTLAASGFRDTTRVASGSPRMGRDILLTNREPMLACLDAYLAQLHRLRDAIAVGNADTLERALTEVRRVRDAWMAS